MLKIQGLRLKPGEKESKLTKKIQRELGTEIRGFTVLKKSIDARKKEELAYIYTVGVEVEHENQVLKRCNSKRVSKYQEKTYAFPVKRLRLPKRPVIVGAGPAGLFCGLMLARIGAKPILIERGEEVDRRVERVQSFWATGELIPNSNVQFGEGGAGTFSDGKLNTGIHDPRLTFILRELVGFGAPGEILYDSAPHVGTDYLRHVVKAIRQELLSLGAEMRFDTRLQDLEITGGRITAAIVESKGETQRIETEHLVLAPGHSARDTFEMLYDRGVPMTQKPFAMGVRIEHLQWEISKAQFGACYPELPPASYKLACHPDTGHSAFSFCVCPGGQVVAAASEPGRLCTNGMSNHARDEENINGALLVSVSPGDFGTDHPLGGMYLQRRLEEQAFALGGGNYCAPCQRVGDFLAGKPSESCGRVKPSYRPGVKYVDLHECLPEFLTNTLEAAIPLLGKKLRGYDDPDALLTALEARSSSPVRITRNQQGESVIGGLYPCGEGAGYAGGIMSAAADGIRVAEWICKSAF